jgi:protein SDA1
MQLLSRVMGSHKLCVLGFYSYIIKYLTYHQLQVTLILVSLAQSVHELTPPDVLTPVVRKIAQEFVHPGVGAEVIAAGLNSIREVCRRQPWCMEEDLLGDLIEYRKSKDKGVVTASRGLLQLFREVNPGLLKRRERVSAPFQMIAVLLIPRAKQPRWAMSAVKRLLMVTPRRHSRASRVSR